MNTDKLQTIMGLFEGVLVSAGTYFATLTPEGTDYTSPIFWVGMAVAVSRGVKGYFAAGVKKAEVPA